jgi:hypothetical protein
VCVVVSILGELDFVPFPRHNQQDLSNHVQDLS